MQKLIPSILDNKVWCLSILQTEEISSKRVFTFSCLLLVWYRCQPPRLYVSGPTHCYFGLFISPLRKEMCWSWHSWKFSMGFMETTCASEGHSGDCFLDRAILFIHVLCPLGLVCFSLFARYVCKYHPPICSKDGSASVRILPMFSLWTASVFSVPFHSLIEELAGGKPS